MLGDRIKQARLEKGLSLSELARRAGLSKSLISQTERGEANPTIESLRAIASGLEVPVFVLLLEQEPENSSLVKANKRMTLTVPDSQAVRELLIPDGQGATSVLVSRIPGRGRSSPSPVSHGGEEWVFVLRGRLEVHLQGATQVLDVGDFLRFDPRLPHYFANGTDLEVEFICSISPARFPPHS